MSFVSSDSLLKVRQKIIDTEEFGSVRIVESNRRKRGGYSIKVTASGILISLSGPLAKADIMDILMRHKHFILTAKNKYESQQIVYIAPETFRLETITFTLRFLPSVKLQVTFIGGCITIYYPHEFDFKQKDNILLVKKTFRKILWQEACRYLPARLDYLASRYGFGNVECLVKDNKRSLGLCRHRRRHITLSCDIMLLTPEQADFVILHELCHLIHPNHSKDFYDTLSRFIPLHKDIRREVKQRISQVAFWR